MPELATELAGTTVSRLPHLAVAGCSETATALKRSCWPPYKIAISKGTSGSKGVSRGRGLRLEDIAPARPVRYARQARRDDPHRHQEARPRIYDEAERNALILLWEASDGVCGKRLTAPATGEAWRPSWARTRRCWPRSAMPSTHWRSASSTATRRRRRSPPASARYRRGSHTARPQGVARVLGISHHTAKAYLHAPHRRMTSPYGHAPMDSQFMLLQRARLRDTTSQASSLLDERGIPFRWPPSLNRTAMAEALRLRLTFDPDCNTQQ